MMRLALASNLAPDRRPLSEYGYHLADGLRAAREGDSELVVLSGKHSSATDSHDVRRVWDYGTPRIPLQIIAALRNIRADGLVLNTAFTSWGSNPANLAGLLTPLLAGRAGFKVGTLLHQIPHTISAARIGYRMTPLHRLAIELGCHAVATSHVVYFTLKRDLDVFTKRYRPRRAVQVPHGLLGSRAWCPPPNNRTVLAFGRWGRGKDPEPLLRVYRSGADYVGRLVLAGPSTPSRPGYVEQLAEEYQSERITFTGYVPERDVPSVFHSADLVVMPYKENAGISGVLHQTCQYGRVPLMRRLPIFEDMVDEFGLAGYFYDNDEELGSRIGHLLSDPRRLAKDGRQNFEAMRALSMDRIGPIYWRLLEDNG